MPMLPLSFTTLEKNIKNFAFQSFIRNFAYNNGKRPKQEKRYHGSSTGIPDVTSQLPFSYLLVTFPVTSGETGTVARSGFPYRECRIPLLGIKNGVVAAGQNCPRTRYFHILITKLDQMITNFEKYKKMRQKKVPSDSVRRYFLCTFE